MENLKRELTHFDLVVDEYGNYYQIVKTTEKYGKLTQVGLVNFFYKKANDRLFNDETTTRYKDELIGTMLVDFLQSAIERAIEKVGKVVTLNELKESGIELTFQDVTKHTNKSIK